MKTTEHGIEDSRDVENMYRMRLMTLLQEPVRERGYKGAARVLEDQRTVSESARTGRLLSRRMREALERALQEGAAGAHAEAVVVSAVMLRVANVRFGAISGWGHARGLFGGGDG